MTEYIPCFACGAKSLNIDGECHEYMLSSPGCWAMFGEIMAREFSGEKEKYWKAHQFTVDAYALQHIGRKKDKRALNSVNIHLASLYVIFEEGVSFESAPEVRKQFSQYYKGKNLLEWLEPPTSFGKLTVFEPWNNENPDLHFEITEQWAKSVWESWSHQHNKIAQLFNQTRK
jgi:hypothetical protein